MEADEQPVDPVEILVNLAKNGEIDPWNIDIVDVTDKFLGKLEELHQMDLRVSGRTLLYASMLLRMKSNAVVPPPEESPEEIEVMEPGIESLIIPEPPVRRHASRPVTLQELITELKRAEIVENRRVERTRLRREGERRATLEEVLDIAHEEDIEGWISRVYLTLRESFRQSEVIVFSELVNGDRSSRLMTYLSLLFLATNRKIRLEQEEFFGELFIMEA